MRTNTNKFFLSAMLVATLSLSLATPASSAAAATSTQEAAKTQQSKAAPKPAIQKVPKSFNSWNGVWVTVGTFGFDPTVFPPNRQPVPYNAEWMKRYDNILAEAAKGNIFPDPMASCIPGGMPRMMNMPYPMELLVTPGQLTIISESLTQVRRVFLDGRGHGKDIWPTYYGDSIGHWEGDTLVVETIGLRDDILIDQSGVQHSDALVVHERMRLINPDLFEDVITLDDPKAFVHPWTVTKRYKRDPHGQIMEMVCEENNRNPVVDGKSTFIKK